MKTFWKRGEPLVWVSGATLALTLLITMTLIGVVIVNGMGVFWPHKVLRIETQDGNAWMGEEVEREPTPSGSGERFQLKVGNRDLYGFDFKWFDDSVVTNHTVPADAVVLERMEYGNFYGYKAGIKTPEGLTREQLEAAEAAAWEQLSPLMEREEEIQRSINSLNNKITRLQRKEEKLLYQGIPETAPSILEMRELQEGYKKTFSSLVREQEGNNRDIQKYALLMQDGNGREKEVLLAEIVRCYAPNAMSLPAKISHYAGKIWELLSDEPRESNTEGGLWPALFGTAMLVFLMSILSFPFGVVAGIYLREYAREGPLVKAVRIAVNNLAGIPSIVYGVFGLGFFVYGVGGALDQLFFPERLPTPTFGTGGILWASMTLGLLTIPVVIVSTEEAFGAIPRGIREASQALGATRFQTLVKVLLPMASPGIMTGFILAMARAAGEVAPLMITGVVKLAPALPIDGTSPYLHFERKFMHLGFHIYDIGFQSPNVEAAKPMVFVTTFLLVLLVLLMTSTAIALRTSMKKKYTQGTF